MRDTDLLTSRAAARAKQLELFARTRVEGFLKSTNPSKLKGHSTDFMQHRQYVAGDDLRKLDWRVFARSDRLVVREYEEYTNLDTVLGLDFSGSMNYGTGELSKIDFVRHCAAMLCYVLELQRDRFGLAALTDTLADFTVPGSGRKHLVQVFRRMVELSPSGETDFAAGVPQILRRLRRRSLFVLFSDCYQEPEALTKALGTVTLQGHDVILYHVYHPDEADLTFPGFTLFRDLETGQVDPADPMTIRDAYREVFREHVERLSDGTARFAIEFHSLPVSADWDSVLAALLRERAQRF